MFTKEDFVLKNTKKPFEFILILPFIMVIAPFLSLAYLIGFILDSLDKIDN